MFITKIMLFLTTICAIIGLVKGSAIYTILLGYVFLMWFLIAKLDK